MYMPIHLMKNEKKDKRFNLKRLIGVLIAL